MLGIITRAHALHDLGHRALEHAEKRLRIKPIQNAQTISGQKTAISRQERSVSV